MEMCEAELEVSFNTCMLGGVYGQEGSGNEQREETNSQSKVNDHVLRGPGRWP